MNWTSSQQAAIQNRGGTLLVSAAAGSGKTAVLVERAVQLICDKQNPISADRLLIVTFTKAAAQELKARIGARLLQIAHQSPNSQWIKRQRILLGRADIGTIDSFCMQLLKRYFISLHLPPDFTTADDALIYTLREKALEKTLEIMYQDELFCKFSSQYGRARSDDRTGAALLAFYDFLRSLPFGCEKAEDFCRDYAQNFPLVETKWGKVLLQGAQEYVQSACALLQSGIDFCEQEEVLEAYLPILKEDFFSFQHFQSLLLEKRWDDLLVAVNELKMGRLPTVRKADPAQRERVKQIREQVKKIAAELSEQILICTQSEFQQDRMVMLPMIQAFVRAVQVFDNIFFEEKKIEKSLEYSDLEHLTLQLLCKSTGERTALSYEIASQYDAVMVDEYQDTNTLQALIYQCLANKEQSNLFFVGDVKQSIYGFRLADPQNFMEKYQSFAPYQEDAKHPMRITLGHNFRSQPAVIHAINDLFSCVMSEQVGGIDYCDAQKLDTLQEQKDLSVGLQIIFVQELQDKQEDALITAQTIAQMLKTNTMIQVGQEKRACKPEDFCILLRTRGKFHLYEEALLQYGIESSADTAQTPFTSPEIIAILSLLRALDHPSNDIAMTGAMLSPMFGFTADDLALLRTEHQNSSFYHAILHTKQPKVQAFAALFADLRELAATESVWVLCDEIITQTHYFSAVSAMENGVSRKENVQQFLQWSKTAGTNGLTAFLKVVDGMLESGNSFSNAPPATTAGKVSIMTIHRSKGLEFPIVLLADCSHSFRFSDVHSTILFHPELGVGFSLRHQEGELYPTIPQRAIKMMQKQKLVSEEMRILYVALTRAKTKLITIASLKNPKDNLRECALKLNAYGGIITALAKNALSFSDWLSIAALCHPSCESLRKQIEVAQIPLLKTQGIIEAKIVTSQEIQEQPVEIIEQVQPDFEIVMKLLKQFQLSYPFRQLMKIPVKMSVSEISHKEWQSVLERPSFLQKEKMSATEKGTAMHTILQFINLEAAQQDLQGELDRLQEGQWILPQTMQQLDQEDLVYFLNSDLCKRMCKADTLYREYAFMSKIDARYVVQDLEDTLSYEKVSVQGIADAVLVFGDTAELVDYKTDRVSKPEDLVTRYQAQLLLYCDAIEQKLGVKVEKCTIYSFHLHCEIAMNMRLASAENKNYE